MCALSLRSALLPFERSAYGAAVAPPAAAEIPWGRNVALARRAPGAALAPPPLRAPRAPRGYGGGGGAGGGGGGASGRRRRGWADSDEESSGDDGTGGGVARGRGHRIRRPRAPASASASASSRSRSRTPPDHAGAGDDALSAEDEWVLCDACRKWRRLPHSIRASSLPDRWTCERGMWGYTDSATSAFTPLSCIVPEPGSSGEEEVAPEEGAPDVALLEGRFWIFAYGAADAARRAAATPAQQGGGGMMVKQEQQTGLLAQQQTGQPG
jgi:hypothetical protein